jgi:glycosyltransferase involved in cell wall biosynthesis
MRVLLVDQFAELGGAQQCLLDLAPAIRAEGWSLAAALPGDGPYARELRGVGADIRFFQIGNYSNGGKSFAERLRFAVETPSVARALGGIAEGFRPDLIYVNGPRVLPAAALAARPRAPLLFHCHNHLPQASAARAACQALRWSRARVISCCLQAVQPLRAGASSDRIEIIYNGVPAPAAEPLRNDNRFTFGVVGRISPEKGQDHFLSAAAQLEAVLPGMRYLLCGDVLFGDPAAIAYRDSLPPAPFVERFGWRAGAGPVISDLDVLVVPSVREPATPRVILEAYARGVPVLAYATGGIEEIVEHGQTGILLPYPDAGALAHAMRQLAESPRERLRAMGENGRSLWRSRFTVERYRRDMLTAMIRAAEVRTRV